MPLKKCKRLERDTEGREGRGIKDIKGPGEGSPDGWSRSEDDDEVKQKEGQASTECLGARDGVNGLKEERNR